MERNTHKIGTIYKEAPTAPGTFFEKMRNSNCGTIMRYEKGGKFYLIKKYNDIGEPVDNGAYTPKVLASRKEKFEKFIGIRESINKTIRGFAAEGGDIIIPCEEFVEDHFYHDVTPFIENCVTGTEKMQDVIRSLSFNERKRLLITAVGALNSVHQRGIVHSDLKLANILLAKDEKTNKYNAKLIDFDNSYFLTNLPDQPGGDMAFCSPELYLLAKHSGKRKSGEVNEREPYEKMMSTESDIFSLGLIFHFYLTGEYVTYADVDPKIQAEMDAGSEVAPARILLEKGRLVVSDKIADANLRSLVKQMLSLKHEDRPTAEEVMHALLLGKAPVEKGDEEKEKKKEPVIEPKKEPLKPSGFDEPWPEHKITFDLDFAKTRSVMSIKRITLNGKNGYTFSFANGAQLFFSKEQAVGMHYAKPIEEKPAEVSVTESFDEPWPEDKIVFDIEAIKGRGYISVKRETTNGKKTYAFIEASGGRIYLNAGTCIVLKMAKRI